MRHETPGAQLWRLLACLFGTVAGGCGLNGLPEQRYASFDVSPSGDQIVLTAAGEGETDLYQLQLSTLRATRIAQTPDREGSATYSPDGKSIAYGADGHIFILSLAGKVRKQLTSGDQLFDSQPSFSSDGSEIVFARAHRHRPYSMGGYVWDDWDVCIMNINGAHLQRITQQNYRGVTRPQLSPDGARVVFSAYQGMNTNLFEVPVAGREPPKSLTTDNHTSDPSLSRDGNRVVFKSDRAEAYNYDLYLMNTDGTNLRRLTDNKAYNQHPVLAPDGHHVFFLSLTGTRAAFRYGLWEVDTESKKLRQIADPSLFDAPLRWKP